MRRSMTTAMSSTTFGGIPLPSSLLARVRMMGARRPLPIQQAAMSRVFAGESLAIHSQTGSGKTLSFMLPLLLRLRVGVPRQVLVCVPTRELAVQTLEHVQALSPMAAVLLRGTEPDLLRTSLAQQDAPVLIATAGQLAKLNAVLEARGGEQVLADLRRTLRTLVLDESDAILGPKGKGGMLNRSRRNRAMEKLPQAQALRRLVERRKDAEHTRVQLVLASATLSARVMRDLAFVVGRRAATDEP